MLEKLEKLTASFSAYLHPRLKLASDSISNMLCFPIASRYYYLNQSHQEGYARCEMG